MRYSTILPFIGCVLALPAPQAPAGPPAAAGGLESLLGKPP
jgi:hypothetical protein